jgi:hypothetical protein
MKRIFAAFALAVLAAGCHGQVPPASSAKVVLTWTAPVASGNWTGCTTAAPCTYAIYRATGATCPASTSTAFQEVTTPTARPSGTTWTDTTATGMTVCYIAATIQGTQNSGPSNTAGPIAVPGVPLAPALGTPSTAVLEKSPGCFDCFTPEQVNCWEGSCTAPLSLMATLKRR